MSAFGVLVKKDTPGSSSAWLRSTFGHDTGLPIVLDISTFADGTNMDAEARFIPSGIPLGRITTPGNTGKHVYGPFDPGATDGRQTLAGFLKTDHEWPDGYTGDHHAALLQVAIIRQDELPYGYASVVTEAVAKASTGLVIIEYAKGA